MKLHCLGTAGYHPSEARHTSCYFLASEGIVLDAGTGMFRLPELIQTETLDILLSHAHLDHTIGLTYLLDIRYQRPVSTVRVWGEQSKLQALADHMLHRALFPADLDLQWHAIRAGCAFELNPNVKATPIALDHPGGAMAFRLDWADKSMAYVTDTTAALDAPYVAQIQDVDLLMHECNFRDEHAQWAIKTGHSCTEPVARVAAACAARQTVLVHLNPLADRSDPVGIEGARKIVSNLRVAKDLDVIEF